jgi:MFS family permease
MKMSKKEFYRAIFMYLIASLFLIYEMSIQVSPSVMTYDLMKDFRVDAAVLGLMVSAYFYSYALMQIPAGILYDHFGPRTLLTLAALMCSVGTLFFAGTETVFWAAFGRFLMGIGSAFAFVGVLVIAARWFDGYYFAFLVGLTQLLAVLGAICGAAPLAKGVDLFGWRGMMYLLAVLGVLLAGLALLILKDKPDHLHMDFLKPEKHLLLHLKQVVGQWQTWALAVYAFSAWGPVIVFAALWGVPYLMERYGITNVTASFATMLMLLGGGLFSPFIGYISNRMRRRKPLLWVGSALGCITSLVMLLIPEIPFWGVSLLLFLMGVGTSFHTLTFALVQDNNKPSVAATGMGFNNMAVVIGGAVLQPLVGYILTHAWSGKILDGVAVYTVSDYESALFIIPVIYLVGLLFSLAFIKESYCKSKY